MAGLDILLFADNLASANTIKDHINSFKKYSQYNWTIVNPLHFVGILEKISFSRFDALVIHYSVFVLNHLSPKLIEKISKFSGPKFQFIQDDYRYVSEMSDRISELGIDTLFTLVKQELTEKAFNAQKMRNITKITTLAGYVPDYMINFKTRPMKDRILDIGYRSRVVPFWLGRLGQEKISISEGVNRLSGKFDLRVDVSVNEQDRLYGKNWVKFLNSCKSTVATESGASIWDFDGTVSTKVDDYLKHNPRANFEEVFDKILFQYEGNLVCNVISPRVFESIGLKTALIMFPGWYSGVLEADTHYIPLNKDFSNFHEVVYKLKDVSYLDSLVTRTHKDIIQSGEYSYKKFIHELDKIIADRCCHLMALKTEAVKKSLEHYLFIIIFKLRTLLSTLVLKTPLKFIYMIYRHYICFVEHNKHLSMREKVKKILRRLTRAKQKTISNLHV